MRDQQNLIEDLMTLGGNLLGNVLSARHELKAQASQRGEQISRMLGLVSREEFDAAFAMLAKARALQDDLHDRIQQIEARLGIRATGKAPANSANASTKSARKSMKANLPSVKKDKRRA